MKKYGIYLAYGPITDFHVHGLGRHLGEFLKAAQKIEHVRFVIAAPRWFLEPLKGLATEFSLDLDNFELLVPRREPFVWKAYKAGERLKLLLTKSRRKVRTTERSSIRTMLRSIGFADAFRRLLSIRNPALATALMLLLLPLGLVVAPIVIGIALAGSAVRKLTPQRLVRLPFRLIRALRNAIARRAGSLKLASFRIIQDEEARLLAELANNRRDVLAWYSPTAFWPQFNLIRNPKLMCVPDFVLAEFPIHFASDSEGGEPRLGTLSKFEEAVSNGEHFITYSKYVKYQTLVDKFSVRPSKVHVIPHGVNRLDQYVDVHGFQDDESASRTLAFQYFHQALSKTKNYRYATRFASQELKFLFYASQFRPNKNVITLLRAYRQLRLGDDLPYKLILTGNWRWDAVFRFLTENDLNEDVLCLSGLTEKELAACYKLASLSVNPSLVEGGMPFTFTESLSTNTPVIMSNIEITREIITDVELQQMCLFDPYDSDALSRKIKWALANLDQLLSRELSFYHQNLQPRGWREVVNDYVAVLDTISSPRGGNPSDRPVTP